MSRKLVIIGPSDKTMPLRFGSIDDYDEWISQLAVISRDFFNEIIFIPDQGTCIDFALKFKELGGKITAVIPSKTPKYIKWAKRYTDSCRILSDGMGWEFLNSHIIGEAKHVLCIGFSAGSIIEICSSKYLRLYDGKNFCFMIDARATSTTLPAELEYELKDIYYFENTTELRKLMEKLC